MENLYELEAKQRGLDNLIVLTEHSHLEDVDSINVPYVCQCCIGLTKKTIYVNFTCNRDCNYCSAPSYDLGAETFFVGQSKIDKIGHIKESLDGIDAIVFSGGEPTLHGNLQKVLRILEYLAQQDQEYYTCLFTNGDFLDENLLNLLKQKGLAEIKISAHNYQIDKLRLSKQYFERVFCEIPAIPTERRRTEELAYKLNQIGIMQLILDELQFTPANSEELQEAGFSMGKCGEVVGSYEMVLELAAALKKGLPEFKIIFCPVTIRKHTYAKHQQV